MHLFDTVDKAKDWLAGTAAADAGETISAEAGRR
jgi:hypothetical protein